MAQRDPKGWSTPTGESEVPPRVKAELKHSAPSMMPHAAAGASAPPQLDALPAGGVEQPWNGGNSTPSAALAWGAAVPAAADRVKLEFPELKYTARGGTPDAADGAPTPPQLGAMPAPGKGRPWVGGSSALGAPLSGWAGPGVKPECGAEAVTGTPRHGGCGLSAQSLLGGYRAAAEQKPQESSLRRAAGASEDRVVPGGGSASRACGMNCEPEEERSAAGGDHVSASSADTAQVLEWLQHATALPAE